METYWQYVDERRASTARDGAQLAVVVENPLNNPGQLPWSRVPASISFASMAYSPLTRPSVPRSSPASPITPPSPLTIPPMNQLPQHKAA